jgi:myo-inositol-1(or 4)-monophosphatase
MILNELHQLAINAAKETGSFLLENKFSKKEIYQEEGRDIKLKIDRQSEVLIREMLENSGLGVFGEEYGGQINNDEDFWVIDPLDGTSNYFRGIDQCCVAISLMNRDTAKIGVIYNFNSGELFTAYTGGGAYLNGNRISVSNIEKKEKASLTTGFPASESIESSSRYLESFSGWKKIRMFGSAALSCAYVASGRCDVYQEKGVYLWDFAAGICLVEEAGGKATYEKIDDSRYSVNFTNGRL